jgi:hypothetical protein
MCECAYLRHQLRQVRRLIPKDLTVQFCSGGKTCAVARGEVVEVSVDTVSIRFTAPRGMMVDRILIGDLVPWTGEWRLVKGNVCQLDFPVTWP